MVARYISILVLSLLAVSAWGGTYTVTSLPDTLSSGKHSGDTWDTVTLSGTKLSTGGNGLRITSDYWYINLGGDTLEFGTDSGSGWYGVIMTNNLFRHIIIDSGWIIHSPPEIDTNTYSAADEAKANNCRCILTSAAAVNYGHDITLRNIKAIVRGYNGDVFYGTSRFNFNVVACSLWNLCVGYTNRCDYDATVLYAANLNHPSDMPDSCYHVKICSTTVFTSPGIAIAISGWSGSPDTAYGEALIFDNTIYVDKKNIKYTTYSGTCYSDANAYAVMLGRCGKGTQIYDNTIRAGSDRKGGRGIAFEQCHGATDSMVLCYDNDVRIHEGSCVEFPDSADYAVTAIKFRYNSHHIYFHDNYCQCIADSSSVQGYWPNGHGITYETNRVPSGGIDTLTGQFNIIENNTFECKARCAWALATGVCFDDVDGGDTSTTWRYNTVIADSVLYHWARYDGAAHSITIEGDTAIATDSIVSGDVTFYFGWLSNNWFTDDIVAQDLVYQGDASDTNSFYFPGTGGIENITIKKTLDFYIRDSLDDPVPNCTVRVSNHYGQELLNDITASDGTISVLQSYWYKDRAGGLYDSTAFRPDTVSAWKNGAYAVQDSTIYKTWATGQYTFTLGPEPAEFITKSIIRGISIRGISIE